MNPEMRKGLFFRRARQRAERYLQKPEQLRGLVERASRKAGEVVSSTVKCAGSGCCSPAGLWTTWWARSVCPELYANLLVNVKNVTYRGR